MDIDVFRRLCFDINHIHPMLRRNTIPGITHIIMDVFVEKIGKLSQKFLQHIKVCIVSRTLVCVGF